MTSEYELTLSDYLAIIRRRAIYLVGIFTTVFLAAIIVALSLPPTYRATGTIMMESQQLSDTVVPNAIRSQLDDQINAIKLRLMTRENLLQLAAKHRIFNQAGASIPTLEMIDKMRDRIVIDTDTGNVPIRSNRAGTQDIAFTLSFEDNRPDVALEVTKDLITLFLDWNIKLRTEGAIETTEFLTQESDKLKTELDHQEKLISDYKQRNRNALPEQLTLRMTMLSRAENDLREVERDMRSIKEENRALEVELAAAKKGLDSDQGSTQSLPALKAELGRLSVIYKDTHPDIRSLKRKIASMESATDGTPDFSNMAVFRIQSKIDSNKARIVSLSEQKDALQQKISENESAMIQTPKVEQGLDVLIRDRDIAKKKFEEFRSKRMNAKIAENLESENKSGRFLVLEPPLLPTKPFKPNRKKIVLGGLILALLSAAAIIMLLETLDKRIRGPEALSQVLGQRPLAIIPYLSNQEDMYKRKHFIKIALGSTAAFLLVILLVLVVIYIPFKT